MKKLVIILLSTILLVGCEKVSYKEISVKEAHDMIEKEEVLIVDVREKSEYKQGHLKNAILIPLGTIEDKIQSIIPNKNEKIILYCKSGKRALEASEILIKIGYKQVYTFGGIESWTYGVVN